MATLKSILEKKQNLNEEEKRELTANLINNNLKKN